MSVRTKCSYYIIDGAGDVVCEQGGLGGPGTCNVDAECLVPPDYQINWSLFFHDLLMQEDTTGEHGDDPAPVPTTAHEYGHAWEGWEDLYDYDVLPPGGDVVNKPVGRWDIMASGGMVHPTPPLKAQRCTEWIEPIDLTTIVTPGLDTVITLPPAELVRDESYLYVENVALNDFYGEQRVERYYLWSAGGYTDPPNFDTPGGLAPTGGLEGNGMLLLHTDWGANADALPRQQRTPPFNYLIVQADGEHQLEDGVNYGDDGDPWPGSTNAQHFSFDTDPASRWYAQNSFTGLEIKSVVPDLSGSAVVTLNWMPTEVPSLSFIDPPGGTSIGVPGGKEIYQIRSRMIDTFGGSWLGSSTPMIRTTSPLPRTARITSGCSRS